VSGLGWNSFSPTSAGLHGGTPGTHLAVVPLERLVGAATGREPDLDVRQGVLVDGPDGPTVYFDGAGLRIDVAAGTGARAYALAGSSTDAATVADAPATLSLHPEASMDGEPQERAVVVVVEPGGIARVATWETVALREAPELRATSQSSAFRPRSTVTGRVLGPATVTVDGASVAIRPDGAFAIEVDAPIWGQEVRVTATDPLGQTSVELVTAIGFVDYRTLPWLPILGVITVLIGLALFVRTPRSAVVHRSATAGDGRLEELDPDRS
jgi:hypothetical protein